MVGDTPTVTLSKAVMERGKKYCEFALIGRLDFNKVERLKVIAVELWLPTGDWKLIPLGRGFFMCRLHSREDFVRIWSQVWKIGEQVLHFTKWTPDFDTDKKRTTNALVWVQFPKLGQQYWDYEGLMTIGKGLGTPVGVDQRTIDRDYGYFANVLVDIDISKPVSSVVNVQEEDGGYFTQDVYIPRLPQLCNHYKSVGHNVYRCRGLLRGIDPNDPAGNNQNGTIGHGQQARHVRNNQTSNNAQGSDNRRDRL
ncbi:hypothetical protein ACHQM5_019337 [Ranunculus cassubicifolius]